MISITITQLRYLIAVFKHKNFDAAARACFVTQPTLSMQIQKLEVNLGVMIFDRSKKPVAATHIGRKIIYQAQVVVRECLRIEEMIQEEREGIQGEFRLGIIPTLGPYLLPLFLDKFVSKYPDVELIIEELQTQQIIEKLQQEEIDAGILVTPLNQRGIVEKPLFYEPFVVYPALGNPLYKQRKVSQKDLTLDDVWLLNEGHCFREQSMELCRKRKHEKFKQKKVQLESGNLETLKRLVDKNFGYTLLPYLAAHEMPNAMRKKKIRFFTKPVPTREVSIVHNQFFLKRSFLNALVTEVESALPDEIKNRRLNENVVSLPSFE